MKKYIYFICAILFFTSNVFGTDIPELKGPVNDYANVFSSDQAKNLSDKLLANESKTTNQVVILTIQSLNGQDIESYAHDVFHTWRLGKKKEVNKPGDNGILFIAAIDDHKMRIEVGYGMEGSLTDAIASQIIRNDVAPLFKQQKYYEGFDIGIDQIEKTISGQSISPKSSSKSNNLIIDLVLFAIVLVICGIINSPLLSGVVGAIGGFFVVVLTFTLPLALLAAIIGFVVGLIVGSIEPGTYNSIISDIGDSSSDSGDSSGYSGGGGDSGGGGASGSW